MLGIGVQGNQESRGELELKRKSLMMKRVIRIHVMCVCVCMFERVCAIACMPIFSF